MCVPDAPGLACRGACSEPGDCDQETSTSQCLDGQCVIVACDLGREDCDQDARNGCEVDPRFDPEHCGACGVPCELPGALAECLLGRCSLVACLDGRGDCNADPLDGCEEPLNVAQHCGRCDVVCGSRQECVASLCTCVDGFADCDNQPGCETPLGTMSNCTGCGDLCARPRATMHCAADGCKIIACADPFADCDLLSDTGCEADTRWDPDHCGGCDQPCDPALGLACQGSSCLATSCLWPMADCSGDPADDCEADLSQDPLNCGQCENTCTLPHAQPLCWQGNCSAEHCDPGFEDCDQDASNGCEADLWYGLTDCGGCGDVCDYSNASEYCAHGDCMFGACDPGFADCDGELENGCEALLTSSTEDCGGCGMVCAAINASSVWCLDGSCKLVCDPGFADCDLYGPNGCETDIDDALYNCQACQGICPQGYSCGPNGDCVPGNVVCSGQVCPGDQVCCVAELGSPGECVDQNAGQNCLYALACDSNADCPNRDERCCFGMNDSVLRCRPAVQCAASFLLCKSDLDCFAGRSCCDSQFPGIQICQSGPCATVDL